MGPSRRTSSENKYLMQPSTLLKIGSLEHGVLRRSTDFGYHGCYRRLNVSFAHILLSKPFWISVSSTCGRWISILVSCWKPRRISYSKILLFLLLRRTHLISNSLFPLPQLDTCSDAASQSCLHCNPNPVSPSCLMCPTI